MAAIVITGHLLRDAEPRMTARSGEWALHLELSPPAGPRGKPRVYRGVKHYGTGHAAAFAAKRRAQDLKRGVRVCVTASGEDAQRGYSLLAPLDHIETPDLRLLPRFTDN